MPSSALIPFLGGFRFPYQPPLKQKKGTLFKPRLLGSLGGADVDLAKPSFWAGLTALAAASASGCVEVVHLLLEAGADKDLVNIRGLTALMLSAREGNVEVARLLLAAGANKDLVDESGTTALIWACRWNRAEIVRLLSEADGSSVSTGKRRRLS